MQFVLVKKKILLLLFLHNKPLGHYSVEHLVFCQS